MKLGYSGLLTLLKTAALAYLLVCLSACGIQRELMYHPWANIQPPQIYGLTDFTDIRLEDSDGVHVHAWVHKAQAGYPTILLYHGNGGNLANRSAYLRTLADSGYGLLALDYRGYGASEGSPSEEGFYQDARATIHYATQELHLPLSQLIVYGESIGTGVAVQMATEFPVGGIVLQSPYTSIETIAQARFPWLPVHYLIWDRFDSLSKIPRIHAPLLLMHGEVDTIIPIEHGKTLFAHANEPKEAVYFPNRGHNDLGVEARAESLLAFCHKYKLIEP